MRPVVKGNQPRAYSNYQDARNDLVSAIGYYCSYCELPIKHMGHVEHVQPRHNGGAPTEWHNLLLACVHCNSPKNAVNLSRRGYFWPDRDNTFRAFQYQYGIPNIQPRPNIRNRQRVYAQSIIDLCALNRVPGSPTPPTSRDVRWMYRREAWNKARRTLNHWRACPTDPMKETIADLARETGFFSVWMEVFAGEPEMRRKFIEVFPGTDGNSFDADTNPVRRVGGLI